jgi:hypothetical protein
MNISVRGLSLVSVSILSSSSDERSEESDILGGGSEFGGLGGCMYVCSMGFRPAERCMMRYM